MHLYNSNGGFKLTRLRYLLLFTAIGLVSFAACFNNQAAFTAGLSEAFTLGAGQSARIAEEDMTVTFNGVTGDSRCPQNVTCVWEGVATSDVTIVYRGRDYAIVLNSPGLTEQATEKFIDYTITYSLNPYPKEGDDISPGDYRLTLTFTR